MSCETILPKLAYVPLRFIMRKFPSILLLICLLGSASCDLEKLTGYKHDYNPIPESARIFGLVKDRHTFTPIPNALIMAGNQATYSDTSGNYLIYYYFSEDDDRNKPVTMKMKASNYSKIDTSLVIFPENEVNLFSVYAAPIILSHALVDSICDIKICQAICQAIVFDNQGVNDIVRVYGKFSYRRPNEKLPSLHTETRLFRVKYDTTKTGYYQASLPQSIEGFGNLMSIFTVQAEDRLAYADSTLEWELGSDSLLFAL
jgi:hypothetical protein